MDEAGLHRCSMLIVIQNNTGCDWTGKHVLAANGLVLHRLCVCCLSVGAQIIPNLLLTVTQSLSGTRLSFSHRLSRFQTNFLCQYFTVFLFLSLSLCVCFKEDRRGLNGLGPEYSSGSFQAKLFHCLVPSPLPCETVSSTTPSSLHI